MRDFLQRWRSFFHDMRWLRVFGSVLPPKLRYIGLQYWWHDGPHYCLGLWWGHFVASPWSWDTDRLGNSHKLPSPAAPRG